ncbi:MAG: MoaD/ThiS family protein [Chloroflexota bacterium]
MKVRVQFLGGFQQLGVEPELELFLASGSDLRLLVEEFGARFGPQLLHFLLSDEGERRPGLAVLINGTEAALRAGLDSRLEEGDTVAFLPVIGGGGLAP